VQHKGDIIFGTYNYHNVPYVLVDLIALMGNFFNVGYLRLMLLICIILNVYVGLHMK